MSRITNIVLFFKDGHQEPGTRLKRVTNYDSLYSKMLQIMNRRTSKCRRFVIRHITQTETERETEAVRSHLKR